MSEEHVLGVWSAASVGTYSAEQTGSIFSVEYISIGETLFWFQRNLSLFILGIISYFSAEYSLKTLKVFLFVTTNHDHTATDEENAVREDIGQNQYAVCFFSCEGKIG